MAQMSLLISASEFPPYEYTENGETLVRGFSSEVIRAVFNEMNSPISLHKSFPWKRSLKGTYLGTYDAIHSTSKNPEREMKLWFPEEPLVYASKVFVFRKEDDINYHSFEALFDLKLGLVRGFNYPPKLWNFIKKYQIQYYESSDSELLFIMLAKGRVNIIIEESVVAKNIIEKYGYPLEILEDYPVQIKPMYLAFSKKSISNEFVSMFSDNLKKFKKTEQFLRLCKKFQVTCFPRKKPRD